MGTKITVQEHFLHSALIGRTRPRSNSPSSNATNALATELQRRVLLHISSSMPASLVGSTYIFLSLRYVLSAVVIPYRERQYLLLLEV